MTRRLRLVGPALLAATAVAAASAAGAAAQGLVLGFSADADLTAGTSASRAPWIQRAVTDGATIVRVNLDWAQVAPPQRPAGFDPADPADPAYHWSSVDGVIRDLSRSGLHVLVTIWDAPVWAEGPNEPRAERPGTWRPDATQFGKFATAAALRYDGSFSDPSTPGAFLPRVRYWQGWNEPNLDYYLSPQWVRSGAGWTPVAPSVYRQLLNAFYASVKAVSPSNFVVMAGTAPYGDALGSDPVGQERIAPVAFYRDVLCLQGAKTLRPTDCTGPAHFDGLDHHPYGVGGPTWHALNPDDVAVPDIYKITRVVKAAVRTGHALPRAPKSMWVSEIGWSSRPPNPEAVPVEQDAWWLEQAFRLLWNQGVEAVLPLEIGDPAPIPNYGAVFESGLYYRNGRAKPLAQAFRFPFLTRRISRTRVVAWGRAPQAGMLRIERLEGGRWATIARFATGTRQVFDRMLRVTGHAALRALVGSVVSLTWRQGA